MDSRVCKDSISNTKKGVDTSLQNPQNSQPTRNHMSYSYSLRQLPMLTKTAECNDMMKCNPALSDARPVKTPNRSGASTYISCIMTWPAKAY